MSYRQSKMYKPNEKTNYFALPSNKTPPAILELKAFEEDVVKIVENIKFRDTKSNFQKTLASDLKKINSSENMFLFEDKTRNIYETSLETFSKLLHDNITKTYKRGSEDNISEIDSELKHIGRQSFHWQPYRMHEKTRSFYFS